MNLELLNKEVQDFLKENHHLHPSELALKKSPFPNISSRELASQIDSRQRAEKKLPEWFKTDGIYFPHKLNLSQSSSEATARYKASKISGKSILDLTAGFGVDSYYFSKKFNQVISCELNLELTELFNHNLTMLDVQNVEVHNENGLGYLKKSNAKFDWIFVDPSRRDASRSKVFRFEDSEPNMIENIDLLLNHTKNVLIKASPFVDIKQSIQKLKKVYRVDVVALNNELKELLFYVGKTKNSNPKISCVELSNRDPQVLEFYYSEEEQIDLSYSRPLSYLYEPSVSILKAGAFKFMATMFKAHKLDKNSHLYTSAEKIDVPGRSFKINEVIPYSEKLIRKKIGKSKANISCRNFPLKPVDLKNKFKLSDGGDLYYFFTTSEELGKILIITEKA